MKDNIAEQVLKYNKLWEETDKITIADNVERILCTKRPECAAKWSTKVNVLAKMTESKPDAVYAWLNRSRGRVKVPFLKLCKIASELNVDVSDFLKNP